MAGVTWSERSQSDWLASNGRWYPRSTYPVGWTMTSLPPAPEHATVGSILRRVTGQFDLPAIANDRPAPPRAAPSKAAPPKARRAPESPAAQPSRQPNSPPRPPANASDRSFLPKSPGSGRGAADAAVVGQRTYKPKVSAGPPPPAALPPPPGRIRDVAADALPDPLAPKPPAVRKEPEPTEDFQVVAGDLGRVFGVAKRRIERAINESYESGK